MSKTFMTSVSFKEYYLEQLIYLEMQHSKSNFICELLKQHMSEHGIEIPQEEIEKFLDCKENKKKYIPSTKQSFSFDVLNNNVQNNTTNSNVSNADNADNIDNEQMESSNQEPPENNDFQQPQIPKHLKGGKGLPFFAQKQK